jgi:hypothetical protein
MPTFSFQPHNKYLQGLGQNMDCPCPIFLIGDGHRMEEINSKIVYEQYDNKGIFNSLHCNFATPKHSLPTCHITHEQHTKQRQSKPIPPHD